MGVQEAPNRESASAVFGGEKPFVPTEADQFGHSARRISFHAHSTIFTESAPSTTVYIITHGTAGLYKMLADGLARSFCPDREVARHKAQPCG